MAVLKKGSKGNDVAAAQKLLNKAGAKPKLNEDGQFGPLTDKQTRKFQNGCDLKDDGKIGDDTLAALKFGGALPVLPESSHYDGITRDVKYGDYGAVMEKQVIEANKKFAALVKTCDDKFEIVQKMMAKENAVGKKRVAAAKEIASLKQDFEKNLKANPSKSQKILPKLEKLLAEYDLLYFGASGTNWRPHFETISKEMTKFLKIMGDI